MPALGFTPEQFQKAYRANKSDAANAVLDGSPVAAALTVLMKSLQVWVGTASELLDRLKKLDLDNVKDRGWPMSARGLSGVLRGLAPALRKVANLQVSIGDREGHERKRLIRITRAGAQGPTASSASSADDDGACDVPF